MVCCGFFFPHSRLVSSRMVLHESPAYGTLQPALPPAMDLPKRSTEVCTHDSTHSSAQSATQISWSLASDYYCSDLLLLCMHITKQTNRKYNLHILLYYTIGNESRFSDSLELYCSVITRDQQREQLMEDMFRCALPGHSRHYGVC
jgi:hypothetical protein